MKTLIINALESEWDAIENVVPSISFLAGRNYSTEYLLPNKEYHFWDPVYFSIVCRGGSYLPFQIQLNDNVTQLKLCRVNASLYKLEKNHKPFMYIANKGGVFEIPKDFSGFILFNITYEKIFPGFPCLGNLKGLWLCGNPDSVQDWKALRNANRIENLGAEVWNGTWADGFNCLPQILNCSFEALEKMNNSLLENLQNLSMVGGDSQIFEKVFQLPNLKEVSLDFNLKQKKGEDLISLGMEIGKLIDPEFPGEKIFLREDEMLSYSEYMSSITERVKYFGTNEKGLKVSDISEVTGDYPMESGSYIKFHAYGISDFGFLYVQEYINSDIVQLVLKTSREKALLVLHRIIGIDPGIVQDKFTGVHLPQPSIEEDSKSGPLEDPNAKAFKEKTLLFKNLLENIVRPVYVSASENLKAQGVDVEIRVDIESEQDPAYYNANAWFSFYNSDRSQWGNFQISQSGYRLDPILISTWNPEKWENQDDEYMLDKISREFLEMNLNEFIRSLQNHFRFNWPR